MKNKVTQKNWLWRQQITIACCIDSLRPKQVVDNTIETYKTRNLSPLSVLINKSFSTGSVPNQLKLVKVITV